MCEKPPYLVISEPFSQYDNITFYLDRITCTSCGSGLYQLTLELGWVQSILDSKLAMRHVHHFVILLSWLAGRGATRGNNKNCSQNVPCFFCSLSNDVSILEVILIQLRPLLGLSRCWQSPTFYHKSSVLTIIQDHVVSRQLSYVKTSSTFLVGRGCLNFLQMSSLSFRVEIKGFPSTSLGRTRV